MSAQRCSFLGFLGLTILSAGLLVFASPAHAQTRKKSISISGVRQNFRNPPSYSTSGGTLGGRGEWAKQNWLIIDVDKDPDTHGCQVSGQEQSERGIVYFMCDPKRPGVTLPTPRGTRRWEFVVKQNESAEKMTSDCMVKELLAPWGDADEMNVVRKTIYTFHARIAKQFRVGNVFLVGDAAHLTPPFAGQGS